MSQIYPDYAYNNPIQRGEIFLSTYVSEGYLEKLRPVVVIQNNLGNKHSRSIIVAAVTSKPKKELPVNVVIDPNKYDLGVENCTIMANQIFTIDKDYLRFKKGRLDAEDLGRLDDALIASFDLLDWVKENQEVKGMNELVKIEHAGQRVLKTQQLADFYETEPRRISENFNRNRGKYTEGTHYFIINPGNGAYTQFADSPYQNQTIYLWTEKGALLHAKSLGTDRAWEVYEMLVDTYFRVKELAIPQSKNELIAAGYKAALELIEEMKPKAQEFDRFISADNLQPLGVVAKSLNISTNGRKMGRNNLFSLLRTKGILMADNTPMQQYINQGYFEVKQRPIQMGDQVIDKPQTYCTPKGITWLSKMLNQ